MEDVFDDFAEGAVWPFADGRDARPRIDVSETDKEVTEEAELPGVDEQDLDLSLIDDSMTTTSAVNLGRLAFPYRRVAGIRMVP